MNDGIPHNLYHNLLTLTLTLMLDKITKNKYYNNVIVIIKYQILFILIINKNVKYVLIVDIQNVVVIDYLYYIYIIYIIYIFINLYVLILIYIFFILIMFFDKCFINIVRFFILVYICMIKININKLVNN